MPIQYNWPARGAHSTGDPGDECWTLGPISMRIDLEEIWKVGLPSLKAIYSEDQRQSLSCAIGTIVGIISNRAIGFPNGKVQTCLCLLLPRVLQFRPTQESHSWRGILRTELYTWPLTGTPLLFWWPGEG
ncbi:LOW QUALITY PROTEIN: hypothetical protein IFM46972_03180 [Aspergillus udagawae]|uniref:Uncharacterized protein n=1 Tax=Aspergillus udagawae TaxID=91492 RepID=A0A8H3NFT2_9EURO|nr:LOW QUALITY PROTEIN: hypothetical protein IFM46972_03180 [Aspergillus udagawae]